MKRELVFVDSKSSKFWNIELQGNSHTVKYGRMGTEGQTKTKEFDSEEAAKKDFDKSVAAKIAKGYVDNSEEASASEDSGDLPGFAFSSILKMEDVYSNVRTFVGRKVLDFDPEKRIDGTGKTIYRFRSDWENDTLAEYLDNFLDSPAAENAVGVVIGNWGGEDSGRDSADVVKQLVKGADRLPNLLAIYLGDVVQEECEMSWIQQSDLSPLLTAFPNLQVLRTRGGEQLKLSKPTHPSLRALALESGGLPVSVVRAVCSADFPNLEHLELWLGTDEYGGDSSVEDLQPIFSGKLFPKLKYLGLRNCEYVDDIATVVVNSPVIDQIESLDLSLGVLTDTGATALSGLSANGSLKKVNLHYNYASHDAIKELKSHALNFDVSKPADMDEDEEWRFVAVGE